MKKASVALVILAGTLLCVGCSSTPTSQVVYDDGKATAKIGEQALPADFPVSSYSNGKVEAYISSKNGDQKVETATISTKDSISTVTAFYKGWFTSNGWTINNETNMGAQGAILMADKGALASQIMVSPDSTTGGTTIQLTISPKNP